MTKAQLQEILELPVPDRLRVAEAIWDSLDEADIPLTDAHRKVLDERLAAFHANPDDTLTWPELKARLERRS